MKNATMTNKLSIILIAFLLAPFASAAPSQDTPIVLQPGTVIQFADVETARKIITTEDDYTKTVGPFDRKLALQSDKDVPHEHYMKFLGEQVLPWTEEEKKMFTRSIERVAPLIAPFKARFPEKIMFMKTTGRDQAQCAYCRPAAVVFPVNILEYSKMENVYDGVSGRLDNLIIHELFHVYSASNKHLHEELYGLIDFKKCNEIELPKQLYNVKISNPDYPNNNYYLEFEHNGQNICAVPFIYSSAPGYMPYRGNGMGMYWLFRLLVIEKDGPVWKCKTNNGSPILLNPIDAWNYFAHIGFNTTYVIAPEEVLAENWCCLVQDQKPFKTPEVVQKLKNFLKKHQKKVPTP